MYSIQHGHKITTDSYYEGQLTSSKQEVEVSLFSTKDTILRDMIDALAIISSGETKKLSIEVCIDKVGRYRVIKKWVI